MDPTNESQNSDGEFYFVSDSAQLTVDNTLRIGAGNIWEEEYTDKNGEIVQGITAGLWFFIRNQPELNQHIRVHKGQNLEIAGYQVNIVDIVKDEGVSLRIIPPQ
jgi:hypothetical protein